jgi:hypothetical protein
MAPMRQREGQHGDRPARLVALVAALLLSACSPTFDWRESRPDGSGASLLFPCRPDRQERRVRVADTMLRLQLFSCSAGEATFSLTVGDGAEPAQVRPLLAALRKQALANLAAAEATERPLPAIAGATPNPESALLRIVGRRADGRRVVAHAAFFVKGLRLYQATVLGGDDDPAGSEALATFFASIRLP